MRNKVTKQEAIFLTLSIFNTAIICYAENYYFTYVLFLYLVILRLIKKLSNRDFLLYALFIPNKFLQLFAVPIFVLMSTSIRKRRLNKSELLFIGYITLIGIFNCILYRAMPIGTVFQIVVYYCVFKIIATYGNDLIFSRTLQILDLMFPIQVISGFLQIIRYREIGDPVTGTLISAHYLGVYLIVYIILIIRMHPTNMKRWKLFVRICLAALFIYLSDAKHVWMIFAFSFVASWIMKKMNFKRKIMLFVLGITIIVVGGTFFLSSQTGSDLLSRNALSNTYILAENYNKKFVYFGRTFNEMLSLNGLFGFGVGQFGSQISLTLSKGIIYWWDSSLSAYHYAIKPFSNAVSGLMTEWYTKYGIGMSSMILGYPLVSFVGLFAELGVIGYLMLLNIFDKRFKDDNPTFIIAFFLLTLFDTYFEIPCVFIMILIATYANPYKKKNHVDQKQGIIRAAKG